MRIIRIGHDNFLIRMIESVGTCHMDRVLFPGTILVFHIARIKEMDEPVFDKSRSAVHAARVIFPVRKNKRLVIVKMNEIPGRIMAPDLGAAKRFERRILVINMVQPVDLA